MASEQSLSAGSHSAASAWPQLGSRRDSDFTIATRAAPAVSDDESVCSSLTSASSASAELERPVVSRSRSSSITSDGSRSPARSRASSFSSVLSSSTSSSTTSRWWHTRADTDDYDDNISWRTAFDGSDLGLNLATAARTPFVSSLTVFPADAARLVKEAAVEEDDETDGLFADVVPNVLALVDGVAKAPVAYADVVKAAPAKAVPVAAAVVTDDDASDEEAKARAVRRSRHEKRRSRNLRKLEHRAARAAQKAAAADAFDAACAEFSC